jgi:hypothetical protein
MASVQINKKQTSATAKLATAFAYGILNVSGNGQRSISIDEVLPFRIRVTNIGIPSYSANSPAPIGIAIVGFNNYIL